jgi:metallo-beta-lactamase class B
VRLITSRHGAAATVATGRVLGLLSIATLPVALAEVEADPAIACQACDDWNASQEPFRVYGNTFYVGTAGLSAILIASNDGLILLDGGLPQSAPLIDANMRSLGYRIEDVKLIGNSHTHFDHAGGIAALQRASGAIVVAGERAAVALRDGGPTEDDPQFAFGPEANGFPRIDDVVVVEDGETLRIGDVELTARFTPGHTPGGTTWTWRSCEGPRCFDIVYADSLNAVSAPGFRFSGGDGTPGVGDSLRRSIALIENLSCDILLSPHPGLFGMSAKLTLREQGAAAPFVDPPTCSTYAAAASERLDTRLAEESQTP